MKQTRRLLTRELLPQSLEYVTRLERASHDSIAQDALRLARKVADEYLEWSAGLCDEEELPLFIMEPRRSA